MKVYASVSLFQIMECMEGKGKVEFPGLPRDARLKSVGGDMATACAAIVWWAPGDGELCITPKFVHGDIDRLAQYVKDTPGGA